MAIYGDMLSFFPEQFRLFDYFSMETLTVSSYAERKSLGKVKAVFQFLKKGELVREGDTLNDTSVPTLWTRKKLAVGNFITADEVDYRITNDYPWFFQGGYYCYGLEQLVASKDTQTPMEDVEIGQNQYL